MSPQHRWTSELVPVAAIAGACLLYPVGGLVFGLAGNVAAGLATPLAQRGGDWCMQRLFRQPELLNHDLQTAMLRAFEQTINGLQEVWLDSHQRDVSPHRNTRTASQDAVKALFQEMRADAKTILSADRLRGIIGSPETIQLLDRGGLTLEKERPEVEASEERNAEAGPRDGESDANTTPLRSADTYAAWLKSIASTGSVRVQIDEERDALRAYLAPYLDGHGEQLVRFMRDNFQSQLACRFGEELKRDTKAWRAFQRLVNDSLLDGVRRMNLKQDTAQLTLDQILQELEDWKKRLARLPITERESTGEAALERVIAALTEQFESIRLEMRSLAELTWARVEAEGIDTRGAVRQQGSQTQQHVSTEVAQARAELHERLDRLSGFSSVAKELDRARDLVEQTFLSPHAYYNGRKPVWANIVAEHDAPRTITDNIVAFVSRYASSPVGAPVAVVQALSGDGKSTIAMRTAATLTEQRLNVVWHNDPAKRELNWKQLDAESRSTPLVAILDDAHQFDVAELESFLEGLAQVGANVLVVLFARRDLWAGSEVTLDHIAEVKDFEIQRLERREIQGILAKLEAAGELDKLAPLSAEERIRAFEGRSKGQLLVALMEAKESKAFSAIVSRSIRDLRKFPKAVEACYIVSALHTFDTPCSPHILEELLDVRSLDAEVLKRTLGMLVAPESGAKGLQMRHAIFATTVFQQDAGRYDRLRTYLEHTLTATGKNTDEVLLDRRDGIQLLTSIRQRSRLLNLDYRRVRELYESAVSSTRGDSAILTQWAFLEIEYGDIPEARRLLEQATDADRTNSAAWWGWANLEREHGDIPKACLLLRQASEALPLDAQIWLARANLEKKQGDIQETRRVFQQATEAMPLDAQLWVAWANLEKEQRQISAARRLLEQATDADRTNIAAWRARTNLEKEQGDLPEARMVLQQAIEAMPLNAGLWTAWALPEKEQGNIPEARGVLQQAPKRSKRTCRHRQAPKRNKRTGRQRQGQALPEKEQGNIPEARGVLQQASKRSKRAGRQRQGQAILEKEQGNIPEARRLFKQATEADPRNAASWQAWAILEKEQGDVSEALRLFWEATEADPRSVASWQAWAILEKEQGDVSEARRLFRQATEVGPRSSHAWQAWAILEKEQGDIPAARRLFQQAIEADPRNSAPWNAWSRLELEANNVPEALGLAEKAVSLDSSNPYSLIGRAQAYQAADRYQEANADLESAVSVLERTIQSSPANIKMRALLAEALISLKCWDKAQSLVRDTVHIAPPGEAHLAYDRLGDLYEAMDQHSAAVVAWQRALSFMPTFYPSRKKLRLIG